VRGGEGEEGEAMSGHALDGDGEAARWRRDSDKEMAMLRSMGAA
jgi:hypothetical protein